MPTKVADFSAPATGGTTFTLSAHRGHPVVLYFYPKDNTPGCTTEGEQFRDLHSAFRKQGAVVAGISRDSVKSHEGFKAKKAFPFELIADTDEALCKAFDVIRMKNMYGKQVRASSARRSSSAPTAPCCANGARSRSTVMRRRCWTQ